TLRTEPGGRGFFEFLQVDGVGPGKSRNKAGLPGDEPEQEEISESEEGGQITTAPPKSNHPSWRKDRCARVNRSMLI
ncbi:MAG TPA: hypothetical protein VK187_07305, partial [Geobacteraceae bacterium]|nr:hypothetical protein [Geobacteraceae bacterium]